MNGSSGNNASPYQAFRRARQAVDKFMTSWLESGNGVWKEEAATERLLTEAFPRIRFQTFTASEEADNGGDWLWWWVDRDGTCFGLLIQAKILKVRGRRWSVDFEYTTKGDDRTQISKLLRSSDLFDVAAAYVLYCGDAEYRTSIECDRRHEDAACKDRGRVGVATLSALVAQTAVDFYGKDAGVWAFHDAVPIEDIAAPDGQDEPIVPLARGLAGDLDRFLREPQRGSRRVAKELLRPVQKIRDGQFAGAAVMQRAAQVTGGLFQDIPNDHGHFPVPYLAHMLRGLRAEVPDYVRDVLEGRTPPAWVTERVAGIVVIPDADAPASPDITMAGDWELQQLSRPEAPEAPYGTSGQVA
ncbi:hypothetical protein [Streptomyces sp. NPDC001743]|uniref:hypothetical protein n=1 Tax=Streptomyces sp. NPDC001743 TaxID=3154397 RepID=UPI00331AAE1E